MKRILIATLVMLYVLSPVQGQNSQEASKKINEAALNLLRERNGGSAAQEASNEINEGAQQYRAGNFIEAQRHFERTLELDPSNKNARLFTARAIHAQYRPGVETPENRAKAREAIEAYRKVLENSPDDDNAYNSVAYLYRQLKEEEKETEWLMTRANSETVPKEKRSDAYTVLASKQWNCSYDITEQPANKEAIDKLSVIAVQYKKPKDESDFYKAQQCVTRGMELVEQAISLNPQNPSAWSYKTNLLGEMAKLAEMEGDAAQHGEYKRQSDEASVTTTKLNEEARRRKQEHSVAASEAAGERIELPEELTTFVAPAVPVGHVNPTLTGVTRVEDISPPGAKTKQTIISGGVLNQKAISKPAPSYPEEAKAARASGTVTVQVVVDETGKVISASAVAGHPLLQKAAVAAARQSTFTPTKLSGQPVKVSGVVTYKFVLQ